MACGGRDSLQGISFKTLNFFFFYFILFFNFTILYWMPGAGALGRPSISNDLFFFIRHLLEQGYAVILFMFFS